MNNNDRRCSRCGSVMVQTGSEHQKVAYSCKCCGYKEYVTMASDDNSAYWEKRSEILGRVRKGVIDWKVTQWQYLRDDILKFTASYEAARKDIYFMMGIIACLTKGFHDMNSDEYKECKRIFKITEKVYKKYRKDPLASEHFASETGSSGIVEYEDYRKLYKTCRNEYRNTKLVWKAVFFVAKKLIPMPKL